MTANVSAGDGPTTFVLIPGAGTDPRVFGATIAALRELGHEGIAPPLPLDDPDATPSDHASAIIAALPEPPPAPLVVVGQSLGAYAATIAAARLRPSRLILLAPMIPAPGESAGDWWRGTDHESAIAPLIERHGTPSEWGDEAMAEVFYHDVDEATLAANAEYDGVPSRGLFAEPLPLDAWPAVPTTVLAGRDDRLFPLAFQRRVARERLGSGDVAEIDGGHLPMLARPRELAARLVELA
ncbi:MAG TPA: alpha/beta hydrolase [Solirubrobacterales bacterium]|nr:alpha/beta hydrolase [Solirubrobacterales bacterium]